MKAQFYAEIGILSLISASISRENVFAVTFYQINRQLPQIRRKTFIFLLSQKKLKAQDTSRNSLFLTKKSYICKFDTIRTGKRS